MMKVPDHFIVHPYVLRVKADNEACRAVGATGYYMNDDHVIYYDDKRPDSIVLDALVHELLHALWDQAGMNELVDSTDGKSDGEKIIRAITPRLIALLRENPFLGRAINASQG